MTAGPETPPEDVLRARLDDSIRVSRDILGDEALLAHAADAASRIAGALRDGGRLLLFGNGGSAADATHLAAEFVGRFKLERDPLPALSLTDNPSSVTAIGNDYAYEMVFERQIAGLGRAGDVAIALSTSGTSRNVVAGLRAARTAGLTTIAFTGGSGGDCPPLADVCVRIPSVDTAQIQEATMTLCHAICEWVEQSLAER